MLSVENLRSSYGRIVALHGVSIVVAAGEIVTLLGANGAGKTTLLRAISGVQPISSGSIRFEDRRVDCLPDHARVALGIAQVPEGRQLFAPLTVGGRMIGTSAAFLTTNVIAPMVTVGSNTFEKVAYAAGITGVLVFAIGIIVSFFLPPTPE